MLGLEPLRTVPAPTFLLVHSAHGDVYRVAVGIVMGHFARVDEDGIVREVVVVMNCAMGGCVGPDHPLYQENPEAHADCGDLEFPDTEPLGQAMLAASGFAGTFQQCSYSGSFRGAYPGQGWRYDAAQDAFVPPSVQ